LIAIDLEHYFPLELPEKYIDQFWFGAYSWPYAFLPKKAYGQESLWSVTRHSPRSRASLGWSESSP